MKVLDADKATGFHPKDNGRIKSILAVVNKRGAIQKGGGPVKTPLLLYVEK